MQTLHFFLTSLIFKLIVRTSKMFQVLHVENSTQFYYQFDFAYNEFNRFICLPMKFINYECILVCVNIAFFWKKPVDGLSHFFSFYFGKSKIYGLSP